jgi:hypothetical protein
MRMPMQRIARALPVFSFAIVCNAPLAASAGIQRATVPLQNPFDPLREERSTLVTSLRASAAGLQDQFILTEIQIDVLQVYGLPLGISNASFRKAKKGDRLKLSISNSSSEQILGVRYWLVIVDSTNQVRRALDQSDSLKLDAYSAKAVSFSTPPRWKIGDDDHIFLMLAQVIGRDSIWEVQQTKSALLAYVKGDGFTMPNVLRLLNQVDSPIGFSPIFLRQKQ